MVHIFDFPGVKLELHSLLHGRGNRTLQRTSSKIQYIKYIELYVHLIVSFAVD